jgi:hypothetical protein
LCQRGSDGRCRRLAKSLYDAGEGFKRPRPAFVAGTLGYFARNHGGTQFALGPIIGGVDIFLVQEAQQISLPRSC